MRKIAKARLLQRGIQTLSLSLFLWLLLATVWPSAAGPLPTDLFLRLDPLIAALIPVSARQWLPALLPGIAVLVLTMVFGRIFCGYLCPMGATLDLARFVGNLFAGKGRHTKLTLLSPHWRPVKYLILTAMASAALAGVNLVFWGSPLALITRFYALLIHPLALLAGSFGLSSGAPLFEKLGLTSLLYATVETRRFDSLYFVLGFFALLFILERVRPRFWCRYLCPAGALLGLLSLMPLWRRRISECTGCNACARQCPAGAIAPGGARTFHGECIVCRACTDVCPVGGASFGFSEPPEPNLSGRADDAEEGALAPGRSAPALPSRRAFAGAAATGLILASVQYSGAHSLLLPAGRGSLWSSGLIRPPAALPEPEFLDRCIRCGACMKVCPSNGLQPAWLAAGPEGMFSPLLVPRRGPCEPACNGCGRVCPTGAIRPLPLKEKQWAKVGTAVVRKERCLAWAEDRRCVVCQEVCPYGSIKLVQAPGAKVPAPVVDPQRCFGCGYCENHCPTRLSSIAVEPLNALRLDNAQYRENALAMGLDLRPGAQGDGPRHPQKGGLPPGFSQ